MTFEEFTEIFDESILPDIKEISKKITFVKTKNIPLRRREIYDAYKHLNDLYKKQIFKYKYFVSRHERLSAFPSNNRRASCQQEVH